MNRSQVERLPPIPESRQTAAQRQAAQSLIAGPRGCVSGPFAVLLRTPQLCERTQRLGEYLRYHGALPPALRELAILSIARHWGQNYEWHAHVPLAERAGISRALIDALAADRDRDGSDAADDADQRVLLRFCQQLQRSHQVDDTVYAAARELLGEAGIVELSALCGYYTLLAMVMNVACTALPAGAAAAFNP